MGAVAREEQETRAPVQCRRSEGFLCYITSASMKRTKDVKLMFRYLERKVVQNDSGEFGMSRLWFIPYSMVSNKSR